MFFSTQEFLLFRMCFCIEWSLLFFIQLFSIPQIIYSQSGYQTCSNEPNEL